MTTGCSGSWAVSSPTLEMARPRSQGEKLRISLHPAAEPVGALDATLPTPRQCARA
jgi:hypothetical protein